MNVLRNNRNRRSRVSKVKQQRWSEARITKEISESQMSTTADFFFSFSRILSENLFTATVSCQWFIFPSFCFASTPEYFIIYLFWLLQNVESKPQNVLFFFIFLFFFKKDKSPVCVCFLLFFLFFFFVLNLRLKKNEQFQPSISCHLVEMWFFKNRTVKWETPVKTRVILTPQNHLTICWEGL